MTIACPHCSAPNDQSAAFCTACGKALPQAQGGPRILSKHEMAASGAGQSLQMEQLRKKMRTAFTTLLALAILQGVVGGLLLALASSDSAREVEDKTGMDFMVIGVVVLIVGAIFLGLALWARRSPLPAAITGLVLMVSLWTIDIIGAFAAGQPELAANGWLIKLIVIVALGNAVSAGVKHRALKKQVSHSAIA